MIMILHILIGFSLNHPAIGYPPIYGPRRLLQGLSAALPQFLEVAPRLLQLRLLLLQLPWHGTGVAPVPKMVENPTGKAHSNI